MPAPSPVQTADTSTPTYGGTMTMYYHEFYNYYDPAMPTSYSYAFWLEGLWAMDWDSDYAYNNDYWTYENVDGQIADTWEIAEDYSSLTVHLREDVYFQSKEDAQYDIFGGRQLMASDVKYTYDRILGLGSGWDEPVECEMNWPSELYMVESVETDGDFTVIFHFNTTTEVALNTFMTTVVNITGPEWDELTADQQGDCTMPWAPARLFSPTSPWAAPCPSPAMTAIMTTTSVTPKISCPIWTA